MNGRKSDNYEKKNICQVYRKKSWQALECDRVSENKGLPGFLLEGLWLSRDGLQEDRVFSGELVSSGLDLQNLKYLCSI